MSFSDGSIDGTFPKLSSGFNAEDFGEDSTLDIPNTLGYMSRMELKTTKQVISALGGLIPVARLCDTNNNATWNWKYYGLFPPRTFVALTRALKKKGHTAPISLWRMIEPKNVTSGTK